MIFLSIYFIIGIIIGCIINSDKDAWTMVYDNVGINNKISKIIMFICVFIQFIITWPMTLIETITFIFENIKNDED